LRVYLEGLPVSRSAPVQVLVNGNLCFDSGNGEGQLDPRVIIAKTGKNNDDLIAVRLKITLKKFDSTIQVNPREGRHLKLSMTDKRFNMQQQTDCFGVETRRTIRPVVPALDTTKPKVPEDLQDAVRSPTRTNTTSPRPTPSPTATAAPRTTTTHTPAIQADEVLDSAMKEVAGKEAARLARFMSNKGYSGVVEK